METTISTQKGKLVCGKYKCCFYIPESFISTILVNSRYPEKVIITGINRELRIYSIEGWEVFEENLLQLPSNKDNLRIARRTIGYATDCDINVKGSISFPSKLTDYLNNKDNILTSIADDHLKVM